MHIESVPNFTGFPSAAEEYARPPLNLHQLLVHNPLSTFFARFEGDAMTGANLHDQDLLVIERATEYREGDLALAFVAGQRPVRRLEGGGTDWVLRPANSGYRSIQVNFRIAGRLTTFRAKVSNRLLSRPRNSIFSSEIVELIPLNRTRCSLGFCHIIPKPFEFYIIRYGTLNA